MKLTARRIIGKKRLQKANPAAACKVVLVLSLLVVLLAAVWPAAASAQRKKCVDCHEKYEDMDGLKFVHEPFKDCETCHKRHGFAQKLVLVKAMPQLCTECHENVAAEMQVGTVHGALSDGRCTVCHNPHASDVAGLLREQESDDPVCIGCHAGMAGIVTGEDAHDPVAKSNCAACHQPHSSEFPALLVASEETVCLECHEKAMEKHKFTGAADFQCRDCHDPHVASKTKKTAAYSHAPFAAGDCEDCHSVEDGEVSLADDFPPADLCETCHDDITGLVSGGSSHFGSDALAAGGTATCLECHVPHTASSGKLLGRPEAEVCAGCHEGLESPDTHSGMFHEPFARGECSTCHEPHGGGTGANLVNDVSTLCVTCHESVASRMDNGEAVHEALSLVDCTECHEPHFAQNLALMGDRYEGTCSACHEKQPFAATHEPYVNSSCGACHRNHATTPGLLAGDINPICRQCHGSQFQMLAAPVQHPPAQDESCDFCHAPHGSDFDGLLTRKQGELCGDCHDVDDLTVAGGPGEIHLHEPVARGDCGGCHNPHGSGLEGLLNRDGEALCYGCHTAEKVAFAQGNVHQPVAEGRCDACHTVHGGPLDELRAKAEPGLCLDCHDFSQPPLSGSHKGFSVTESKCSTCHNPHNSPGEHLLNAVAHEPFADGDCESCHEGGAAKIAEFDAETCFMCHDDKQQSPGHQQVAGVACISCHSPHTSRFEALLENPARLCRDCHESIFEAPGGEGGQLTLHKPLADGLCLDCHKMHDSPEPGLLATGQLELCSGCHESIRKRADHLTKHDPFGKGRCSSCHATHAASEDHMLKKDEARLCKSCHRISTPEMAASHGNITLSGENCTTCHDPHSTPGASTSLIYAELHPPYEDGDCESCHQADGSVRGGIDVCFECHDEDAFSQPHVAGRTGESITSNGVCLDCHSPHAGHGNILRRDGEMETCLQCHDRKEFTRKNVHAALDNGCSACHDVHRDNYSQLMGATTNELCADCHEGAEMHVHPVGSEYKDPRTGNPLTCASCHEPHSSEHEYMLTFDHNRDLCVQCHASGTMRAH